MKNEYELYSGADVMVDYKSQLNQDVIDYFEEQSMFEGFATLDTIDENDGTFTIKEMPNDILSVEYLLVMNNETNEFEYYSK